jgi:mannose-6-phosphate isomerase-like protein (cupin superfamily)
VLDGRLCIFDADRREHVLDVGDTATIPGGEPHVVTNPLDRPATGLDIFVPGRSFDFWLNRKRAGQDSSGDTADGDTSGGIAGSRD